MPAVRLVAEGIGPFEKLDLDLSDGRGNPHLGPHILAGVNGSGKSTALRALAWVLEAGDYGFPHESWQHGLAGHAVSRAALLLKPISGNSSVYTRTSQGDPSDWPRDLWPWIEAALSPPAGQSWNFVGSGHHGPGGIPAWGSFGGGGDFQQCFNYAAYTPSRALQYLPAPDPTLALRYAFEGALCFESTVRNEVIHSWLLSLYSKRAIAKEQGLSSEPFTSSLDRVQDALTLIFDQRTRLTVDISSPQWQLLLRFAGSSMNFSQIPDGVRSTIGWLADFTMRQELFRWSPKLAGKKPGILLIDEVDAHLHPRWQRQILPALRKALPDVQIIVATHSPFVISSCAGARVHVLEVDERGRAHAERPMDAPFGQSINATLKDIFGVESRWDLQTERELAEWEKLKKRQAVGRLSVAEKRRFHHLTEELSQRSEELRSIVGPLPELSPELVRSLTRGKRAGKR